MRIKYTTWQSFIVAMMAWGANLGIGYQAALVLDEYVGYSSDIVKWSAFGGGFIAWLFLCWLLAQFVYHPFGAWLYCLTSLLTFLSWREAMYVSMVVQPNETGRWHPMKHVLQLNSQGARRSAILEYARHVLEGPDTPADQ